MKLLAFVCNSFSWTDFKSRLTNLDMWAVPKLEGSNSMLVGVWSTAAGTVATAFHSLPLCLRVIAAQKYIAWLVAIKSSAWLSPAPTFCTVQFLPLTLSTRVLGSTVGKGFHMSLFMTAACGAGLHTVSCLLLWNGLLPSRALHVATLGWMVQMCFILYHFEICDITWCAENWVLRGVYADETEYGFLANHSLYYRQLTDQQCKL